MLTMSTGHLGTDVVEWLLDDPIYSGKGRKLEASFEDMSVSFIPDLPDTITGPFGGWWGFSKSQLGPDIGKLGFHGSVQFGQLG